MISEYRERQIAIVVALAFSLLATGFSLGPIFEGVTEFLHFLYVRQLVATRTLPDPRQNPTGQYHQAPLYYVLVAPILAAISDTDFPAADRNPFFGYAFATLGNDNKNAFLHHQRETFPFINSSTSLAVHLMRLPSILMGLGTVIASYGIFRKLWPDRPDRRLVALGIVAFWPQFVFLSGMITNDNLLFLTATTSLLVLLGQWITRASWQSAVLLGLTLSLALLAKANAVFLIIPVGTAIVLERRTWRYVPLTLGLTLTLAGWWYARNLALYGDPTGLSVFIAASQGTVRPGWTGALEQLPFAYSTLWARFGETTVPVGPWVYRFYDLILIFGLAGAGVQLVKIVAALLRNRPDSAVVRRIIIVCVFMLTWIVALLYGATKISVSNQGRYLLPGIAGWAAVLALGLDTWTPNRFRFQVVIGFLVAMAGVATMSLFGYYYPAYRPLPVPAHIEYQLNYQYENVAELIGASSNMIRTHPGNTVTLTLYWRALQPSKTSLVTYLHSLDSAVVRRDSYPATGNLLSTDWQPGQTWAERFVLTIPVDADAQNASWLVAGLYDPQNGRVITARQDNTEVLPIIGRIAINGPAAPIQTNYLFGSLIELGTPISTSTGSEAEICLPWHPLDVIGTDYHVFVHILAADGQLIAQSDSEPKEGRYPTSAWAPNEVIIDCHKVSLPDAAKPGWQIELGLYDLASGMRLPVTNREGTLLPNDAVRLSPDASVNHKGF